MFGGVESDEVLAEGERVTVFLDQFAEIIGILRLVGELEEGAGEAVTR